ncbi:hypothetical protein RDWZM_006895 [Blomia tropicalis]|uniref:MRG domain-containing protein n=1 Tax=Blomia tropicalis TaxID=40697 RepID=A0A9Q0M9D4_BLOTA|nr:hypothetical protein RDWZM_006895 [Blomia tropicalis]
MATPKSKSTKSLKKKTFDIGSKILCYDGPHLYEAKCLDYKKTDKNKILYLVHYIKFKSICDEWVDEERVLQHNAKNLQLKDELRLQAMSKKELKNNVDSRTSESEKEKEKKVSSSSSEKRKKKIHNDPRKHLKSVSNNNNPNNNNNNIGDQQQLTSSAGTLTTPSHICPQEEFLNMKEVKIRIPEDLKTILVDDWELIANQNKLLPLPTKLNIHKILTDYFYLKTQASKLPLNHTIEGYFDFLSSIRKYFNYLLERYLLYPTEQEQLKYLKENYTNLIEAMASDSKQVKTQKETRNIWKRFKKSSKLKKQQKFKIESIDGNIVATSSEISTTTTTTTNTTIPLDNQSQTSSETSESIASNKDEPQLVGDQTNVESMEWLSEFSNNNDVDQLDYTKLFGAIHLLRLFTRLGHFLFFTDLNEERLTLLNSYIYDFMKYLSKNLCLFWNYSDSSNYIEFDRFITMINNILQPKQQERPMELQQPVL